MIQKPGSFTISLDFELYWGMRDIVTQDAYKDNLLGVWKVIPTMLSLFEQYDIHVTWATVGFLMHEELHMLESHFPDLLPQYSDETLCPYRYLETRRASKTSDEYFKRTHFAKALVEKIKETPHQEIGTHTYSHYYTREPNISVDAFEADLQKAFEIAKENHIEVDSLVFPRNQIDITTMDSLKKVGIKTYRGNPVHWAYRDGESEKTFLQRVYRFFDIYLNLSGSHTTVPSKQDGLTDVKSSLFLRPYSKKFQFLESLKLRRVNNAMSEAAHKGENFHLWWHPHNFGINQEENMANLEEILQHFNDLKKQYGMVSLTMQELGEFYE